MPTPTVTGLNSVPLVMYLLLGIMVKSAFLVVLVSSLLRRFHRQQSYDVSTDVTLDSPESVTKKVSNATEMKLVWSRNQKHPMGGEARPDVIASRWMGDNLNLDFVVLFCCCCD